MGNNPNLKSMLNKPLVDEFANPGKSQGRLLGGNSNTPKKSPNNKNSRISHSKKEKRAKSGEGNRG